MSASSAHVVLAPVTHNILNVSFSQTNFDYLKFWRLLTTKQFPEQEARIWMQNHYYFTLQV